MSLYQQLAQPSALYVSSMGYIWDASTLEWIPNDGSVTLNAGSITIGTVNQGTPGASPWLVSASSLPLPTGASTEATLSSLNSKVTAVNTGAVVVASSALPTGAATAALQTQPGVDIGDVTVNNASGAGAVNIQDGGNSITVDGTVTANAGTGPWPVTDNGGSLTVDAPVGTPVFVRLSDGAAALTTTSGRLAVDPSGVTSPVSIAGTVSENLAQVAGNTVNTGVGAAGTGTQRVVTASDSTIGTVTTITNAVTVQQATATNLKTQAEAYQGGAAVAAGNPLQVTLANTGANATAVKVDGSAVTQPVSGTVTANQGGTWTVQPGNTANTTPWLVSSKIDTAPSSPTAASVGVASAQAVAANASRKGLYLVNTSNNTISLGLGAAAVLNSGITLAPRQAFWMDEFSFDTAAVNAIASAAASNLAIQEFV